MIILKCPLYNNKFEMNLCKNEYILCRKSIPMAIISVVIYGIINETYHFYLYKCFVCINCC